MKKSPITKICIAAFLGSLFGQIFLFVGMPLLLSSKTRDLSQKNNFMQAQFGSNDLYKAIQAYRATNSTFSLKEALHSRDFLNTMQFLSTNSRPVFIISQGPLDLQKPYEVEAFHRLPDLKSGYIRVSGSNTTPEEEIIEAR